VSAIAQPAATTASAFLDRTRPSGAKTWREARLYGPQASRSEGCVSVGRHHVVLETGSTAGEVDGRVAVQVASGSLEIVSSTEPETGKPADNSVVRPSSDIIARKLGESAVLIRMRTSRIYELNATGARIWELLKQHSRRDTVVESLCDEFHIDRREAEAAVDELIETLRGEGLL
jgi:hypothetical protein